MNKEEIIGADFSADRKYRYSLWRIWDKNKPLIMFIGLNPSTANEKEPDPTITRVIGFARDWGYGGVYMMNCFPIVSSDPKILKEMDAAEYCFQVLNRNDSCLARIASQCEEIIFAWGKFKIVTMTGVDRQLMAMFPEAKVLVKNKNGSPRHPLYVHGDTLPYPFINKQ